MVSCFNEVNGFLEFISVILQTGSVPSSGICVYITVVSLDGLILSSIDKPFVSDFGPALFSHLLVSIFLNCSFGVYCLCFCFPPHFASFFLGRDTLLFLLIVCFQVMVFRGSWVLFWTVLPAWLRSYPLKTYKKYSGVLFYNEVRLVTFVYTMFLLLYNSIRS